MSNVSARERGRANADQFIKSLSVFDTGWDDDDEISEGNFHDRLSDAGDEVNGITSRSANQLIAERTAKKLVMSRRYVAGQELFSPEEIAEDALLASTVVEVDPNDINRRLKWGYTLLIDAAVKGDLIECKRLKLAGADLSLEDNAGKMAWQKAQSRGYAEIAKLLKP